MHIKDFLEAIDYEITGGEEFLWKCYGDHARYLDFEVDLNTSISAVYSTKTQQVFEVTVTNEFWRKAYIWIDPEYITNYFDECSKRNIQAMQAFDGVSYEQVLDPTNILNQVVTYKRIAKLSSKGDVNE